MAELKEQTNIRLTEDMKEGLVQYAEDNDLQQGEAGRKFLEAGLAKEGYYETNILPDGGVEERVGELEQVINEQAEMLEEQSDNSEQWMTKVENLGFLLLVALFWSVSNNIVGYPNPVTIATGLLLVGLTGYVLAGGDLRVWQ